jgi:two-component system, OmpR family, phosphate regulon sensor histidine kinase PhoR
MPRHVYPATNQVMANLGPQGRSANAVAIDLEETDLAALLSASLGPLTADASRQRIELRVVTLGTIPPVAVDREKIAWCITTLVGNALRYVRKSDSQAATGGSVLVHVEYDEEEPDIVAIAVQDDGPGIPEEKLPYLFERRTGALHAEGLALTLVREIVAAHGGEIHVESRRGVDEHGTSVTIRLRR